MTQVTENTIAAAAGQTVAVPTPALGSEIAIASAPNGVMAFSFDPSAATITRVDNSLVFDVDGGGAVTITDYFVVGDQSLPMLRLPDGTEIDAEAFFTAMGSDLDLSTAAGPAAGPPPGGRGSSYADDAGSLMGGVDKYGMLGTDYWGRGTNTGLDAQGLLGNAQEVPGIDSFGFSVSSLGLDGLFRAGLFESGMSSKHTGDRTQVAGQLHFDPVLTGTTVIDSIRLSGFTEGTKIFFGQPQLDGSGNCLNGTPFVTVGGAGQVISFTHANFTHGVFLLPPPFCDNNMNITGAIDIRSASSGLTSTVNISFVIVVDAVADLPIMGDVGFDGNFSHADFDGTQQSAKFKDGYNKATDTIDPHAQISLNTLLKVTVDFYDVADGSEDHFLLLQIPASMNGVTWTFTFNGVTYSASQGISIPGKEGSFLQIPVPNDMLKNNALPNVNYNAANGHSNITLDVAVQATGTAEQLGLAGASLDKTLSLEVGAMAVERLEGGNVLGRDELDLDNNTAINWAGSPAVLQLDTVNSGIQVKIGWGSEGHDSNAHHAGDGHTFDSIKADASRNAGAPIYLSLLEQSGNTNADRGTNPDFISEIEFRFDGTRGDMWLPGDPRVKLVDGANQLYGNALITVVTGADGQTVVTIKPVPGFQGASLNELLGLEPGYNMTFKPEQKTADSVAGAAAFDSSDVALSYTVVVENGLGNKVIFSSGDNPLTVVIDAVADLGQWGDDTQILTYTGADRGTKPGDDPENPWKPGAATPGDVVTLQGEIFFPDHGPGSAETHFALIAISLPKYTHGDLENPGYALGLGSGAMPGLLDAATIKSMWSDLMLGTGEGAAPSNNAIENALNQPFTEGKSYLLIEVDPRTEVVTLWAAGPDGMIKVDHAALGISIEYKDGVLTYSLPFQTPAGDGVPANDIAFDVSVTGVSVENFDLNDREYDYSNNIAVTKADTHTINVDVITGTILVNEALLKNLAEDLQPNQWQLLYAPDGPGGARDETLGVALRDADGNIVYGPDGKAIFDDTVVHPEFGVAIFLPTDAPNNLHGGSASEYVSSMTFTLGENFAKGGTLFYNGEKLVVDADGKVTITGTHPTGVELDKITFMPTPNWSGELDFSFTATISSNTSGQTIPATDADGNASFAVGIHVDSVADLASAAAGANKQDTNEDGSFNVRAEDGVADEGAGRGGWFVSEASRETAVQATLNLVGVKLHDTDGSEFAQILIPVMEGITLVQNIWGLPAERVTLEINGEPREFYVFAEGQANAKATADDIPRPEGLENAPVPPGLLEWLQGGAVDFPITLSYDYSDKNKAGDGTLDGGQISVFVRTEEIAVDGAPNYAGNDISIREVEVAKPDLTWMYKGFTLEVGWVSEGNNANKHLASGGVHGVDSDKQWVRDDMDANARTANGAPVALTFHPDIQDWVSSVSFTVPFGTGVLQFNGMPLGGVATTADGARLTMIGGVWTLPDGTPGTPANWTMTIDKGSLDPSLGTTNILELLEGLTFMPGAQFSDDNINLSYQIRFTEDGRAGASDATFVVTGNTTIVVDAVADRAPVEKVELNTDDAVNGSVALTITANFPDKDGSETHYILVEAKLGWTLEGPHELHYVFFDANGKPISHVFNTETQEWELPFKQGEPLPSGVTYQAFWKIDVTEKSHAGESSFTITLKPDYYEGAVSGGFQIGTLAWEGAREGEWDFGNNMAYDIPKGNEFKPPINVIDATIGVAVTAGFEGGAPLKHGGALTAADQALLNSMGDPSTHANIIITIGKHEGGAFKGNTGDFLNTGDGNYVTLTFGWAGDHAEGPGHFTIRGNDTKYEAVLQADGTYKLTIPAGDFGAGNIHTLTLQYHPPAFDDTDLTGITVSVPVHNDTGFTKNFPSQKAPGDGTMVIDAVADRPDIELGWEVLNSGEHGLADWGSVVKVEVGSTFFDLDGSERHYLFIEARPGWTVTDESGVALVPQPSIVEHGGKSFFYVDVTDITTGGNGDASHTFFMQAPGKDGHTDPAILAEVGKIYGNQTITFKTGGLAVEGAIVDGKIVYDGSDRDSEVILSNNKAWGHDTADGERKDVTVDFGFLKLGASSSGWAFETVGAYGQLASNAAVPHSGYTANQAAAKSGWINITLADPVHNTIVDGSLTFTFEGGTPGNFSWVAGGKTVVLYPGDEGYVFNPADNTWTVTFPADTVNGGRVDIRYNPPAFDDGDLTNVTYTLNITNEKGQTGVVTGSLGDRADILPDGTVHTESGTGTFIVDAVANAPSGVNGLPPAFADGATAVGHGGTVNITVSAKFLDLDGSETHYLLIQRPSASWTSDNADGIRVIGGVTYFYKKVDADAVGDTSFTFTLQAPNSGLTNNSTLNLRAGGLAIEGNSNLANAALDLELSLANNQAHALGNLVSIPIRVITTQPNQVTLALTRDKIFENLDGNAHLGIEKGQAGPIANANDPAVITVSGVRAGDVAHITLSFQATEVNGTFVDFSGGTVWIGDRPTTDIAWEGPDANGWFSATVAVPGVGTGSPVAIKFDPGYTYSDANINVRFEVTEIINTASGQSVTNNLPKGDVGVIQVDPVAQIPLANEVEREFDYFPGSADHINLATNIHFRDWADGSERHSIVLQAKIGYGVNFLEIRDEAGTLLFTLTPNFTTGAITVSYPDGSDSWAYTPAGGLSWVYDNNDGDGRVPYHIFAIDPELQKQFPDSGNLFITFNLTTPENAVDTSLKFGAISTEDLRIGDRTEDDWTRANQSNDTAIMISEFPLEIRFDHTNLRMSIATEEGFRGVFEGDARNAHRPGDDANRGDYSAQGGAKIIVSLAGVPQGALDRSGNPISIPEHLEFRFELHSEDGRGTIFAFPNEMDDDGIRAFIDGWRALLDNPEATEEMFADFLAGHPNVQVGHGPYTEADYHNSTFVFVAFDFNDKDITLFITGTSHNTKTGQTFTYGFDNGEYTLTDSYHNDRVSEAGDGLFIIVDAVAQMPELQGMERGEGGVWTASVFFPDKDGSESHFILIEARPGGTLTVDGIPTPNGGWQTHYHKNADGSLTKYWKIPVDTTNPDNLDENGNVTLTFTYPGAGNNFTYGAMAVDMPLKDRDPDNYGDSDFELTYHNNVAVNAGGTGTIGGPGPGDRIPPGHEIIPPGSGYWRAPVAWVTLDNEAYENGTPKANLGGVHRWDTTDGDAVLEFRYLQFRTDSYNHPEGHQGWGINTPVFPPAIPESITITFDPSTAGMFLNINGVLEPVFKGANDNWVVEFGADGKVTVTINNFQEIGGPNVHLRPGDYSPLYDPAKYDPDNTGALPTFNETPGAYHNNNDKDFTYGWSMSGLTNFDGTPVSPWPHDVTSITISGSETVIVDAVAQGTLEDSLNYNRDDTVLGADTATKTVTLSATMIDTDGSEDIFFLIEMIPGVVVRGADGAALPTLFFDGKLYYRVEGELLDPATGHAEVTVQITVDRGRLEQSTEIDAAGRTDGRLDESLTTIFLSYGAMTKENLPYGDGELSYSNNQSFNMGTKTIEVSYVNSSVGVSVTPTFENKEMYQAWVDAQRQRDPDFEPGRIQLTFEGDSNDKLAEFRLTFDPNAGSIRFGEHSFPAGPDTPNPVPGLGKWVIEGPNADGKLTLVLSEFQNANGDLLTYGDDITLNLIFDTTGKFGGKDSTITWEAVVVDEASRDRQTFEGERVVIIDAVAQAPVVGIAQDADGNTILWNGSENVTGVSGGATTTLSMTLTFTDTSVRADGHPAEKHYAVIAVADGNKHPWDCTAITIHLPGGGTVAIPVSQFALVYSADGTPFYAVEIQREWLDANGQVRVDFTVRAPEQNTTSLADITVGGIAVESFNQPDGELTLNNNWGESLQTVSVWVVEGTTRQLGFEFGAITEGKVGAPLGSNYAPLALSQASIAALEANHEVITSTTFTFTAAIPTGQIGFTAGQVIGTVIYDGRAYEIIAGGRTAGTVTVPFNPATGYEAYVVWGKVETNPDGTVVGYPNVNVIEWNKTGANMTVTSDSALRNTLTGETTGPAQGSDALAWTPVAEYTTDIGVTGPSGAFGSNAVVPITVSASFADTDGSERHYILLEAPAGWTLHSVSGNVASTHSSNNTFVTIDNVRYLRVEVSSTHPNPTVTINMITPNLTADDSGTKTLSVGSGAEERGVAGSLVYFPGNADTSVSVDLGFVQGVRLNIGKIDEFNHHDTSVTPGMPLTFEAIGAGNTITAIRSITLNNPAGRIVDADGNTVVTHNGSLSAAQIAALQSGALQLFFVPDAHSWAGQVRITFTADVNANGVTQTFTGQAGTGLIYAVTDTPEDATGNFVDNNQLGHKAELTLTFQALFGDRDGSEDRFFLVVLPEGVALLPGAWVAASAAEIAAAGLTGQNVIKVAANNAQGTASIRVIAPEGFEGNVLYVAGALDTRVAGQSTTPGYEFTDLQTMPIETDKLINIGAPVALGDTEKTMDAMRDGLATAPKNIGMFDADGNTVKVTQITFGGNTVSASAADQNGNLTINGQFGFLTINVATGVYTYTLHANLPAGNYPAEKFEVTFSDKTDRPDDYLTGSTEIEISLNAVNQAPTAAPITIQAGGGNYNDLLHPGTGNMLFVDNDGDRVVITNVTGGEATRNNDGSWTVVGKYGILTIQANGASHYQLVDTAAAPATESFTVHFRDDHVNPYFNLHGSSSITVNVADVNHRPEIENQLAVFDGNSSLLTGMVAFTDPDAGTNGDVRITSITWNGSPPITIDVTDRGVAYNTITLPGLGTFGIRPDGSFAFSLAQGATVQNAWELFTITVADPGGLEATASFALGTGNPGEPPFPFMGFSGASAELGLDGAIHAAGSSPFGAAAQTTESGTGGNKYGGDGDIIFATQEDDVLFSTAGKDIFTWESGQLGGNDKILNFDFNGVWTQGEHGQWEFSEGSGYNDQIKLKIDFNDLLPGANDLDGLLTSLIWNEGSKTFSLENGKFEVEFAQNTLEIAFAFGEGQEQRITVESKDSFFAPEMQGQLTQDQAMAILQHILENS